jgi:cell division protein ZapA
MSSLPNQVSVQLLGKGFTIRCPEDKKHELEQAAQQLNGQLQSLRMNSKASEFEQLLVIAALNVTYDLRTLQQSTTSDSEALQAHLKQLQDVVSNALIEAKI